MLRWVEALSGFLGLRVEVIQDIHSRNHPLLLAVDLEWAQPSVGQFNHPSNLASCSSMDSKIAFVEKRAAQTHNSSFVRESPNEMRLSLLQMCVEKQREGDAWPPSSENALKSSCMDSVTSRRNVATESFSCTSRGWTQMETSKVLGSQCAKVVSSAELADAVYSAILAGSVCVFDLAHAPISTMENLGRLLENPTLPKVVRSRRHMCASLDNINERLSGRKQRVFWTTAVD